GKKTEPNYFKKFEANPEVFDAIDVQGTGYNTESLIKKAISIKNEAIQKKEPYIETWCVFDKDDFPIESFEKAIKLADQNQIKCAYSIEAFEIWYMLHFNFCETALSRLQYNEKLSELLKKPYSKNDTGMYLLLSKRQSRAIQNAKKLYDKQYSLPLKDQNPITTVFQLVERLIG
ncbi:MAG: RloB family protein, partial [Treponema sp.]|nr:RloB family protein [Treponema sp.]